MLLVNLFVALGVALLTIADTLVDNQESDSIVDKVAFPTLSLSRTEQGIWPDKSESARGTANSQSSTTSSTVSSSVVLSSCTTCGSTTSTAPTSSPSFTMSSELPAGSTDSHAKSGTSDSLATESKSQSSFIHTPTTKETGSTSQGFTSSQASSSRSALSSMVTSGAAPPSSNAASSAQSSDQATSAGNAISDINQIVETRTLSDGSPTLVTSGAAPPSSNAALSAQSSDQATSAGNAISDINQIVETRTLSDGNPTLITLPASLPTGGAVDWKLLSEPVEIEINSIVYVLPFAAIKVDHLDDNYKMKTFELSQTEVKIDGATYNIPKDFSGGEASLKPASGKGPEIKARAGQKSKNSTSGGIGGFLKGLGKAAGDVMGGLSKATSEASQWASGGFSTAGDSFSTAVSAIDDAVSAAESLAADARQFAGDFDHELSDLGANMPVSGQKVFDAYEGSTSILNQLKPLQKILKGFTSLRGESIQTAKNLLSTVFALAKSNPSSSGLVLAISTSALFPLALFESDDGMPYSSGTISASTSSKADTSAKRKNWIIRTHPGTSLATYRLFLSALPDTVVWSSDQTEWPETENQQLIMGLSDMEAKLVQLHPIYSAMYPEDDWNNTPDDLSYFLKNDKVVKRSSADKDKRNPKNPAKISSQWLIRDPAPAHLSILSQAKQNQPKKPGYVFDKKLGYGTTIYVVDLGFDPTHTELSDHSRESPADYYVVPNHLSLGPYNTDRNRWAPRDLTDWSHPNKGIGGYRGHGTGVAAVALGKKSGVAPRANLVGIKVTNAIKQSFLNDPNYPDGNHFGIIVAQPSCLDNAFRWIIKDITTKQRQGKAVIVSSVGFSATNPSWTAAQQLYVDQIWANVADFCLKNAVLWMQAAGNDGDSNDVAQRYFNHVAPHSHEKKDNAFLIVGGTDELGRVLPWSTMGLPWNDAQTRIYAQGRNVETATSYKKFDGSTVRGFDSVDGTSYSAPAIGGLAAYFLSLDALQAQQPTGRFTALGLKNYLIDNAHELYPPGEKIASGLRTLPDAIYAGPMKVGYNRASENICDTQGTPVVVPRSINSETILTAREDADSEEIVVEDEETENGDEIDWSVFACPWLQSSGSMSASPTVSRTGSSSQSSTAMSGSTTLAGSSSVVSSSSSLSSVVATTVLSSTNSLSKRISSGSNVPSTTDTTTVPSSSVSQGSSSALVSSTIVSTKSTWSSSTFKTSRSQKELSSSTRSFGIETTNTPTETDIVSSINIVKPPMSSISVNLPKEEWEERMSCNKKACGHSWVNQELLKTAAKMFCSSRIIPGGNLTKEDTKTNPREYSMRDTTSGLIYDFKAYWAVGCTLEKEHQFDRKTCADTVWKPIRACGEAMVRNYDTSKNYQAGGTYRVGCAILSYEKKCDPVQCNPKFKCDTVNANVDAKVYEDAIDTFCKSGYCGEQGLYCDDVYSPKYKSNKEDPFQTDYWYHRKADLRIHTEYITNCPHSPTESTSGTLDWVTYENGQHIDKCKAFLERFYKGGGDDQCEANAGGSGVNPDQMCLRYVVEPVCPTANNQKHD